MIDSFSGEHEFLSNFWTGHPVVVAGLSFATSEHAFQAMKSEEFTDKLQVQACKTPGQAKRMGRRVKLRPNWEEIKLRVMEDVVRGKFDQNPELMTRLLATGEEELVEGNNHGDRFWGTVDGVGENHLGKTLMKVRHDATVALLLAETIESIESAAMNGCKGLLQRRVKAVRGRGGSQTEVAIAALALMADKAFVHARTLEDLMESDDLAGMLGPIRDYLLAIAGGGA